MKLLKQIGEIILTIFFGALLIISLICAELYPSPTLLDVAIELITLK